jgi:hypothetical protein
MSHGPERLTRIAAVVTSSCLLFCRVPSRAAAPAPARDWRAFVRPHNSAPQSFGPEPRGTVARGATLISIQWDKFDIQRFRRNCVACRAFRLVRETKNTLRSNDVAQSTAANLWRVYCLSGRGQDHKILLTRAMRPVSRAAARIAKEILRYTKKNPEAADTSERSALSGLHSKYPLAEVKEALDHLIIKIHD